MKQENQKTTAFHQRLKSKMDAYAHLVYKITKTFPRDELYGVTSQLRRATLSVILNYTEGYARQKTKVHTNFLETSYGSLKESKYLLEFSLEEGFINQENYDQAEKLADEIGAMLWSTIENLKKKL
jgi:four helix bundle protein